MGRRNRQTNAEWLITTLARLPWWACLLVGLTGYLVCASVAQSPAPTLHAGNLGQGITAAWMKGLAYAGVYLFPIIGIAAAFVSFFRQRKDKALFEQVKAAPSQHTLNGLSWQQFERLVAQAFQQQGYAVTHIASAGPDGGVDIEMTKDKERFLVQCKQWRATKVGVAVVRELLGVMVARGATGAFVVTSGTFTDEAAQFASGRNIKLIHGAALLAELDTNVQVRETATLASDYHTAPACPKCASPMVRRTAKRGANAGSAFLGCSRFPVCHGTRPIA